VVGFERKSGVYGISPLLLNPGSITFMATDTVHIIADLCALLQRYNKEGVELTGQTALSADLNVDSVEIMDLVMELEEKFGIDIPINLLFDVENVDDLAKIVHDRMKGQ
jgi:acyl carrier protein